MLIDAIDRTIIDATNDTALVSCVLRTSSPATNAPAWAENNKQATHLRIVDPLQDEWGS
ncbi:hypothetical protein N9L68_05365 [bacterium]|nr:hypothetical protein [bacterium]